MDICLQRMDISLRKITRRFFIFIIDDLCHEELGSCYLVETTGKVIIHFWFVKKRTYGIP
jgi:hypothetical protein